jgi:uncharacterized protein DUF2625
MSDEPWQALQEWVRAAKNACELLPGDDALGADVLGAIGVTTSSPMGCLARHSGGLLIDNWLRILGGGGARMRGDLARWNGLGAEPLFDGVPGAFVVAVDVAGGVFAIDRASRHVAYFAPDSLRWESLNRGYSDFVVTMLNIDLDQFYDGVRWPTWRHDVRDLPLDDGIHAWPPPWTVEGRSGTPSRRRAPLSQIVRMAFDVARQLDG